MKDLGVKKGGKRRGYKQKEKWGKFYKRKTGKRRNENKTPQKYQIPKRGKLNNDGKPRERK